jgi:hypothetical protein
MRKHVYNKYKPIYVKEKQQLHSRTQQVEIKPRIVVKQDPIEISEKLYR